MIGARIRINPLQYDRSDSPTVSSSLHCAVSKCRGRTREGKPHCPRHVEHSPYVKTILAKLAQHERLKEKAKKGSRGCSAKDYLADLILDHLTSRGQLTKERIARELALDIQVVDVYVNLLVYAGRAHTRRGHRSTFVISLERMTCQEIS